MPSFIRSSDIAYNAKGNAGSAVLLRIKPVNLVFFGRKKIKFGLASGKIAAKNFLRSGDAARDIFIAIYGAATTGGDAFSDRVKDKPVGA